MSEEDYKLIYLPLSRSIYYGRPIKIQESKIPTRIDKNNTLEIKTHKLNMGAYAGIYLRIKNIDNNDTEELIHISGLGSGDDIYFLVEEGRSSRHLEIILSDETRQKASKITMVEDKFSPMSEKEAKKPIFYRPVLIGMLFNSIRREILLKLKNEEIALNDKNRMSYFNLFSMISGIINACNYASHLNHEIALVYRWE